MTRTSRGSTIVIRSASSGRQPRPAVTNSPHRCRDVDDANIRNDSLVVWHEPADEVGSLRHPTRAKQRQYPICTAEIETSRFVNEFTGSWSNVYPLHHGSDAEVPIAPHSGAYAGHLQSTCILNEHCGNGCKYPKCGAHRMHGKRTPSCHTQCARGSERWRVSSTQDWASEASRLARR